MTASRYARLKDCSEQSVKPEKMTTPPPAWAADLRARLRHRRPPVVREVTDYQDFTGHIEASQTAEIRARATGNLDKVCFKPGMSVKQGDLLFEIDPRLVSGRIGPGGGRRETGPNPLQPADSWISIAFQDFAQRTKLSAKRNSSKAKSRARRGGSRRCKPPRPP